MKASYDKAFTLIELAIVIVIIGLITGGVLGAQSLVKSAKVQDISSQMQKIHTSYRAFHLEYDAIPGTFNQATQYWPSGGTSDGDGGDVLDDWAGGDPRRFVQHLDLAGIFPNRRPEIALNDGYWELGHNNGMIYVFSTSLYGNYSGLLPDNKNIVHFISQVGGSVLGNSMSPKTLYRVDKKIDDGIHDEGILRGTRYGGSSTCVSSDEYLKSSDEIHCKAFYILEKL